MYQIGEHYFKREPDGSVGIYYKEAQRKKPEIGDPETEEEFNERNMVWVVTIPCGNWPKVVVGVSARGFNNDRYKRAADLHDIG